MYYSCSKLSEVVLRPSRCCWYKSCYRAAPSLLPCLPFLRVTCAHSPTFRSRSASFQSLVRDDLTDALATLERACAMYPDDDRYLGMAIDYFALRLVRHSKLVASSMLDPEASRDFSHQANWALLHDGVLKGIRPILDAAAIALHRPGLPTAFEDCLIKRVRSHNSPVRLQYLRAAASLLVNKLQLCESLTQFAPSLEIPVLHSAELCARFRVMADELRAVCREIEDLEVRDVYKVFAREDSMDPEGGSSLTGDVLEDPVPSSLIEDASCGSA